MSAAVGPMATSAEPNRFDVALRALQGGAKAGPRELQRIKEKEDERYRELEAARDREREREARQRARALAKLTAKKVQEEAAAEAEAAGDGGAFDDALGATASGREAVQLARAPLEGMASEAPRVDVGDFAAKRAAKMARAKALREQKGLALGSRKPGIGSDMTGGDWGRYDSAPGFGSPAAKEPGPRSQPRRAERPAPARRQRGQRRGAKPHASAAVAACRSILALDPTDKEAMAALQVALAEEEQERQSAGAPDAAPAGSSDTGTRRERRQQRRRKQQQQQQDAEPDPLRAGSQSCPLLGPTADAARHGVLPALSLDKKEKPRRGKSRAKSKARAEAAEGPRPPMPTRTVFSSRDALAAMKLSELRKHGLEGGVAEQALEDALDTDDPKGAVVAAILAHTDAISAKEERAIAEWRKAEEEWAEEQRRREAAERAEAERQAAEAERLAVEEAARKAQERAEAAAADAAAKAAAARADEVGRLRGLKLSQLRRRAAEEGLGEEELEAALDADDPKSAMVDALMVLYDANLATAEREGGGGPGAESKGKPARGVVSDTAPKKRGKTSPKMSRGGAKKGGAGAAAWGPKKPAAEEAKGATGEAGTVDDAAAARRQRMAAMQARLMEEEQARRTAHRDELQQVTHPTPTVRLSLSRF